MSEQEELLKELFCLVESGQNSKAINYLNMNFKINSIDLEILENYLYSKSKQIIEFILTNMNAFISKELSDSDYLSYKAENSKDVRIKEFYRKSMLV